MNSVLTKSQRKTFSKSNVAGFLQVDVVVRYDDQCGNGHNTFSITGSAYQNKREVNRNDPSVGGCIHDIIHKAFPELRHLIKWHLVSSDGPMHYIANTTYLASDRDHNGLQKGEVKQITNGRIGHPMWELQAKVNGAYRAVTVRGVESHIASQEKPDSPVDGCEYMPWCRIGEGKEPNLEAARSAAIWPDATLEQLQDKELLKKRLPELMSEFKKDIEEFGFVF